MFRIILIYIFAMSSQATTSLASQDVLIYYANETNLNEKAEANYKMLFQWLSQDTKGKGPKIQGQLESDLKDFSGAVADEVTALTSQAIKKKDLNVLVFTNKLSSRGQYLLYTKGFNNFKTMAFKVQSFENYIVASHPNSQATTLASALEAAASQFDPKTHRFTLITKSHGSKFFIMVPRITIRHESSSQQQLSDLVNGKLDVKGMPPWMEGLGTSRQEFFNVLKNAGEQHNMEFALVFTESCKSRVGIETVTELPKNISTLISPKINLDYKTINYAEAFTTNNPIIGIGRQLTKRFASDIALRQETRSLFSRSFFWWLPLLILILIGSGYKIFRSSPKSIP